jgi:hypothetical protein
LAATEVGRMFKLDPKVVFQTWELFTRLLMFAREHPSNLPCMLKCCQVAINTRSIDFRVPQNANTSIKAWWFRLLGLTPSLKGKRILVEMSTMGEGIRLRWTPCGWCPVHISPMERHFWSSFWTLVDGSNELRESSLHYHAVPHRILWTIPKTRHRTFWWRMHLSSNEIEAIQSQI